MLILFLAAVFTFSLIQKPDIKTVLALCAVSVFCVLMFFMFKGYADQVEKRKKEHYHEPEE